MRKSIVLLTLAVLALGGWNVKLSRDLAQARAVAVSAALDTPEEPNLSDVEGRLLDLEHRVDDLESTVSFSELADHDLSEIDRRLRRLELGF